MLRAYHDYIPDDALDRWHGGSDPSVPHEDQVDEDGCIIPDYDEPDYIKEAEREW